MTRSKKSTSVYRSRRRARSPFTRLMNVHPVVAILTLGLLVFIAWRVTAGEPRAAASGDFDTDSLLKVTIPADIPSQPVAYPGFELSFNAKAHQPNFVAWELTAEESEASGRRESKFAPDDNVDGCATLNDYRGSGFDRGHMIPAADVKWSADAMQASHYLTNITPQEHSLNSGPWASLEGLCRNWARRDSAIIIICGPVLSDRMPRSIGKDNIIPVPERFFKVVLAPYTVPPRGIAFVMNNGYVEGGVQSAAVSIDDVEAITGFDFFASLPDSIENEVERQCQFHVWQRRKR